MLQPPFLDRCRSLNAPAVYVETNSTHLLNSAYGNPRSEVMNPWAAICLPLEETPHTSTAVNHGSEGGTFTYSDHTLTVDSPAADPGWVDPVTKCQAFADDYLSGSSTGGNALVAGEGSGIGFWYQHKTGATATAHTGMHAYTTSVSAGFANAVTYKVSFAADASCRKPTATIYNGTTTVTLEPDHSDFPWEAYGQDNGWHHIAVTENGAGTCKLYIDGLEADAETSAGFDYTDDAAATNWTIGVNADADGSNLAGEDSITHYSFPTVYSVCPSTEDIARIVHSFRRPLDIEIDATVSARALTKPGDGGIERCDHGYVQPIDLSVGSGTTDRNFRLTDWRLLEHALPETMAIEQTVFLFHRLMYDTTQTTPADEQGTTKLFNLEGIAQSAWSTCAGPHSAGTTHTEKDGWYVERNNLGWKLGTSYIDSGNADQYHEFHQDDIYPAQVEQEYESVLLMHTKDANSTLSIRQGKAGSYVQGSPPAARFGTQCHEEAKGGVGIDRGAYNDGGRYGSLAVFRQNLTVGQYNLLRRLTLGQAQLRCRPGLRALNRHFTQNAPSRVQGFIQ